MSEAAIKRATGGEDDEYEELLYEGYAPHGVALLIETATDNPVRTIANIRVHFKKHEGNLGATGIVGSYLGQLAATLALVALATSGAQAQDYPDRAVRIVVPFAPGGVIDPVARIVAKKLQDHWGQPVVIENRPGASTTIGTAAVAKAAPDGYTLMWSGNAAITLLPSLQKLPFDPLKDFDHISIALGTASVILVNNDLPVKSLADLVAYAKANPGKLSYGSPGVGTPQHVAGELLCRLAGVREALAATTR